MDRALAKAFIAANEEAGFDEEECRLREDYRARGSSESTVGVVGSVTHLLWLAVTYPEKFLHLKEEGGWSGEDNLRTDSMGKYDQIIY